MAKLKPIITTQEKLNTIDIKEGQFICVKDSNSIYIDTDTERLEYTLPRILNYLQSGNSISIGGPNTIQGDGCVVLGNGNTVSSGKVFILGQDNTVPGECAIPVIGSGNVLPENTTNAVIIGSHSNSLTEITNNCINVGFLNKIIGRGYAYGEGLQTTNDFETALGAYNLSSSDIVFSIGNGTDNDNRSNIFTIYNDGKVESSSFIGASITNWQSNYLYKINELVVYNNILYQCNINHTSLETFEENKWTILLSAKDDSFNFNDLSTAMTTGIQSGIRVIADEENERFNFEVTGIPAIAIDSDGYWTINGERGENPTKAQGNDGFTPSITTSEIENGVTVTIANKEGTISTNILNGEDGFSPSAKVSSIENGVNIEIIDKDGTTTANVLNGLDGITPHIDDLTKNWFIGETNTGVKAESSIEINADCAILYATFLASGWSETAPYTQTVLVNGINENNVPIVDISYSEDSSLWKNEYQSFSNLTKIETINGSIIGTCLNSKPIYDFTVKLKIAGDITYDTVISKEEFNTTIGNINTILASVTGGVE